MSGPVGDSVGDSGPLASLSTPARDMKMIDLMKFTKKGPKVIDKEGADVDSRSIDNCNVLRVVELVVVKLRVVNKGRGAEGVAVCLKLGNNRIGPVCREFKNMKIP
mmetsp:Transcript_21459/g.23992  ORF Transcript_21459/g.23992 Transcript_21459/m.23992 type:complete len:106 (+) Transcript_21459:187-504(+)